MSSEKGEATIDGLQGEAQPPPYETILDIPDWTTIPPPSKYDDPVIMGLPSCQEPPLDAAYPPPAYGQEPHNPSLPRLAYADFLPKCISPGDALQAAQFDDMKTLMTIVNHWLKCNPQFTVIRCESIERMVDKTGSAETETTIRFEGGYATCHYVRGIRLWLNPNISGSPAQQLWYMNIVPQSTPICMPAGMGVAMGYGMYGHPVMAGSMMMGSRAAQMYHRGLLFPAFENLDKVLKKLNQKLQSDPIPGQVLTIESIDTKYAEGFDWKRMEPDACSWSEKGATSKLFLTILRIFFVIGPPEKAEIDIVDFAPLCLDSAPSLIRLPKFEPLTNTIQRAQSWIIQQQDKRIINIQTVTTKLMNNILMGQKKYDTREMDFTSGFGDTSFIKVVRVPYVKKPAGTNPHLTCRTFVPVRFGPKISETMSQTVGRVNQWLNCTGVKVFGVDTLEYEFSPQARYAIDTNRVSNTIMQGRGRHWISTIRLYIDGDFTEPPEEIFPPIPAYVNLKSDSQTSSCCAML